MAYGSGAFHVHRMLEENISGYRLCGYNPYLTLFPPLLNHIYKKISADLIHTNPDYGFFFNRKDKPLVITFHSFVLDKKTRQYGTFLQRLHYSTDLRYFTRKSLMAAVQVTCVSKFTANIIQRELGYTKPIKVIYNGIDTEKFGFTERKRKGPIKVLFSGHPTKRKGADLLPLIADKLNKGIIILYTSGIRKKQKKFNSLIMQDIGSFTHEAMPRVYQEADILIFPSVREGFGLAAAEAMASGLPVVATNCSSLPELVVDGKGGYLCELGNADAFARRINELADSPELRKEMGQFNRERIENEFTLEKMVKNYRSLFEEILSTAQ